MRRARETTPGFPKVLLFHVGDVAEGYRFFSKHWPGAHAVADPERRFYEAFGRRRSGWREYFGARVWSAAWRALRDGHGIGRPVGNVWAMPGAFLVRDEAVVWSHDFEHVGDRPAWAQLPRF